MIRAAALAFAFSAVLGAQNEAILREHFEGRYVVPKLDMPGDSNGIDLKPGEDSLTNDFQIRTDLQRYGTAIRRGQRVKVTAVKVKKDHIEFQLDGGGFGSFTDRMTTSSSAVKKSSEEERLERERRDATGSRKRYIDSRLQSLRSERERQEKIMKERAAQGDVSAMSPEQIRRRTSGSRFNIRYPNAKELPNSVLTPDGLQALLAPYLSFDPPR